MWCPNYWTAREVSGCTSSILCYGNYISVKKSFKKGEFKDLEDSGRMTDPQEAQPLCVAIPPRHLGNTAVGWLGALPCIRATSPYGATLSLSVCGILVLPTICVQLAVTIWNQVPIPHYRLCWFPYEVQRFCSALNTHVWLPAS